MHAISVVFEYGSIEQRLTVFNQHDFIMIKAVYVPLNLTPMLKSKNPFVCLLHYLSKIAILVTVSKHHSLTS